MLKTDLIFSYTCIVKQSITSRGRLKEQSQKESQHWRFCSKHTDAFIQKSATYSIPCWLNPIQYILLIEFICHLPASKLYVTYALYHHKLHIPRQASCPHCGVQVPVYVTWLSKWNCKIECTADGIIRRYIFSLLIWQGTKMSHINHYVFVCVAWSYWCNTHLDLIFWNSLT